MAPPNDAVMNDTEDVSGEVTVMKTQGQNRLGRPKTYFPGAS